MIVDTSAVLAALFREEEAHRLEELIAALAESQFAIMRQYEASVAKEL